MHISSDEVFSKILKKPSIVCTENKMIPHMKAFGLINKMNQNGRLKKGHFPAPPNQDFFGYFNALETNGAVSFLLRKSLIFLNQSITPTKISFT